MNKQCLENQFEIHESYAMVLIQSLTITEQPRTYQEALGFYKIFINI